MQFYTAGEANPAYSARISWQEGLLTPGASQMQFLKKLILSKSYFDRVPDQSLIIGNGEKYNRILATRGNDYAMFYVYNGREFQVDAKKLQWGLTDAYWFNPKDGITKVFYTARMNDIEKFIPPEEKENGNDWVLIFEKSKASIQE